MMRIAGFLLLFPVFAGCVLPGTTLLPSGYERLRLAAPLTLDPGQTRVEFQQGRLVSGREITVWMPVCALVFAPASETRRMVDPATWRITGMRQDYDAGGWMRGVTVYQTLFMLEGGADGPSRLECEVWRSPEQPQRPLEDEEIRSATGDWLHLY